MVLTLLIRLEDALLHNFLKGGRTIQGDVLIKALKYRTPDRLRFILSKDKNYLNLSQCHETTAEL